jgi:hypothetical protein
MSLYGALDKTKHFDEFDSPLVTNEGVLAPSTRRARARANIDVPSVAELAAEVTSQLQNVIVVPAGGAAVDLTAIPEGGKVLIPLVTANVTATLPAPTAGLTYEFIYFGSAADAEDWVISCPSAVLFQGGIEHLVTGTADIDPEIANGSTENTLTVNNPTAGTYVIFIGTGTAWAVTGTTYGVNIAVFSAV